MTRAAAALAPVRLDFAGGWTDVPPFSAREGGMVVNAAIGLFVRAELKPVGTGYHVIADDIDQRADLPDASALATDGRLDLHKAVLRMYGVPAPATLTTRSEDVALVTAVGSAVASDDAPPPARPAVAEAAWRLEAVEVGVPGGRQDQWAAALGGFNALRFRDPVVEAGRLELDSAFADELAQRIVLCYTGASRLSGNTIARVMNAYECGDDRVVGALRELCEVADGMAAALRAADLARVGSLLTRNWHLQQALDARMSTPEMGRLEAAVMGAGALGGKAAGSGAGGCMFFLAGDDLRAARAAAVAAGAELLPVRWEAEGVRPC